jgi:hypothetical protein
MQQHQRVQPATEGNLISGGNIVTAQLLQEMIG